MPGGQLTIHFHQITTIKTSNETNATEPVGPKYPLKVYVKYFATIDEVIMEFNRNHDKYIKDVYNEYGQKIPSTYNIQKSELHLYYH